ncbi:VWA domain-containing protein [Candidatus Fermentibacteria bacterium]|nr:VWA domain-containing protein [Candidatus Fermentibacteria bacterium]
MTRQRLIAGILLVLPLVATGCRCGHERFAREPSPARAPAKGLAAEETREKAMETWEPSLYLIPESDIQVVDEADAVLQPRAAADELWVIVRRDRAVAPPHGAALGAAATKSVDKMRSLCQPISISAKVTGFVVTVDLRHTLVNSTPDTADFVYEFPLPEDASVRDFTVTLGPRTIRGVIRAREEALSIYRMARQRGLMASLIEQQPESMRHAIDNVPPGHTMNLGYSYCGHLAYVDAAFQLTVPLNMAVRSAGMEDEGVGWPDSHPDHTPVTMTVELGMGVPIRDIASPSHEVDVEHPAPDRADVRVTGVITTGEDPFVLRCFVAADDIQTGVFSHRDQTGDYVGIMLLPPADAGSLAQRPLDVRFLLDCSSSMRGMNLHTAKHLVEEALAVLDSTDTFTIASFGGQVFSHRMLPASSKNIARAVELLRTLPPDEGEGMLTGLRAALALPHDQSRQRVLLVVTDGYIDDPAGPVLEALHKDPAMRVFCFGTGTVVNRLLLEAMAVQGRGGVAYLKAEAAPSDVARRLLESLSRPALTDVAVDLEGTSADLLPRRLPDLYPGRPVTLIARCSQMASALVLTGRRASGVWSVNRPVPPMHPTNPALAMVWARRRLAELIRHALADSAEDIDAAIQAHALEHGLLSPHTSFLTVDTAG